MLQLASSALYGKLPPCSRCFVKVSMPKTSCPDAVIRCHLEVVQSAHECSLVNLQKHAMLLLLKSTQKLLQWAPQDRWILQRCPSWSSLGSAAVSAPAWLQRGTFWLQCCRQVFIDTNIYSERLGMPELTSVFHVLGRKCVSRLLIQYCTPSMRRGFGREVQPGDDFGTAQHIRSLTLL